MAGVNYSFLRAVIKSQAVRGKDEWSDCCSTPVHRSRRTVVLIGLAIVGASDTGLDLSSSTSISWHYRRSMNNIRLPNIPFRWYVASLKKTELEGSSFPTIVGVLTGWTLHSIFQHPAISWESKLMHRRRIITRLCHRGRNNKGSESVGMIKQPHWKEKNSTMGFQYWRRVSAKVLQHTLTPSIVAPIVDSLIAGLRPRGWSTGASTFLLGQDLVNREKSNGMLKN